MDRVFRGILNQGLISGKTLRAHMSLNLSARERFPDIRGWLRKSFPRESITLTPEGWYVEGNDVRFEAGSSIDRKIYYESGSYMWVPPPPTANVSLEKLRFAKSKKVMSAHLFIVSR